MTSQMFKFLKFWNLLRYMFVRRRMKNAYLPKVDILLQFGGEILELLCSSDPVQSLLIIILPQF